MQNKLDVLVIASHPDDAEIGLGGTLAMLADSGKRTGIIDLSDGEPTPFGSHEIRASESQAASKILNISFRTNLGLPNREIIDSIDNRKLLANQIRSLKPEILFIPYCLDAHPDHLATYNLSIASRFYAKLVKSDLLCEPWWPKKIFLYFAFHLRANVTPSFVVAIDMYFAKKMAAISAYESQFKLHTNNRQVLKDIEADARYWGSRIYCEYGEPLICLEQLAIRDAQHLFGL